MSQINREWINIPVSLCPCQVEFVPEDTEKKLTARNSHSNSSLLLATLSELNCLQMKMREKMGGEWGGKVQWTFLSLMLPSQIFLLPGARVVVSSSKMIRQTFISRPAS